MKFTDWWDETYAEVQGGSADRTTCEEAWEASRKAAWAEVFQIVSDNCDQLSRAVIKKLEAARKAKL